MPHRKPTTRGCCILSLQLDTGNFNALYIDGKVVSKMFFNGEEIYDASKWFAIGNKYTSAVISTTWGGSSRNLYASTNTSAYPASCIGNVSGVKRNTYCCETNKSYSEFTDLGSISLLGGAFNYLPISSFLECKNIYYVARFQQKTYDGDLLIKPFIRLGRSIHTTTNLLGTSVSGIGNKSADNADEGFSFMYLSSDKGKIRVHKSKLSDTQVKSLNHYAGSSSSFYPDFLCKAFKTDDSTTATKTKAYYGGFLLLEV